MIRRIPDHLINKLDLNSSPFDELGDPESLITETRYITHDIEGQNKEKLTLDLSFMCAKYG